MSTFRAYFSDCFSEDRFFELTGTASYNKFPSLLGGVYKFQSRSTNKGSFMIGPSSGSLYYEIYPGEETDWLPIVGGNLGGWFFSNISGSSERLTVWSKG